jgi:membrane-associated phospholipid phosphatase
LVMVFTSYTKITLMNSFLIKKLLLLIFIFCPFFSFTQSKFPYQIDLKKEGIILGAGVGLEVLGLSFKKHVKPLSVVDIQALDKNNIRFGFDRKATNNWSPRADKVSDILLYSAIATPVLLSIIPTTRRWKNAATLTVMGLETILVTHSVTQLVKNTSRRIRPFVYNPAAPLGGKFDKDARKSFFSGHTSGSAAMCFFTAQAYADTYPHSRSKYIVWGGAAALPIAIGYYRYKAGKHFPTDIAVGYLTGLLCGVLIPKLHLGMVK